MIACAARSRCWRVNLAKRSHFEMPRAVGVVWEVLAFLVDQRCPACHGRQFSQQESSIKACAGYNGRGLLVQTVG